MQQPYLVITGIPRSGTTLAASLVDRLQDTISLNEPPEYYGWSTQCRSRAEFVAKFVADLGDRRRSLERKGTVLDCREEDGSVPTNYFNAAGHRRKLEYVPVSRVAESGQLLIAVKHNEPLTAVLPELCKLDNVQIAAIIRHPVPTILSWRSRDIPLAKGNLSAGYRFWDEALAIRAAKHPLAIMQAKMFELYCARYWEHRDRVQIIKYEDLIGDSGILERLTGRKFVSKAVLATQNRKLSTEFGDKVVNELKQAMIPNFKYVYKFYPDFDQW